MDLNIADTPWTHEDAEVYARNGSLVCWLNTVPKSNEAVGCGVLDFTVHGRLIAAAPDLLEALKKCYSDMCGGWNSPATRNCAAAAIAKAEGKT